MDRSSNHDARQRPKLDQRRFAKRPKTFHQSHDDTLSQTSLEALTLCHSEYTVAWICALYIEMAAAKAMLDSIHESLPMDFGDSNTYVLGNIGRHNIVIAGLPDAHYGTNNAANIVTNISRSFPSIRFPLVVGIGGGAPGKGVDVRLGDVVVGTRVMQYDLGKIVQKGQLKRTAIPKTPGQLLGTAVSALRAKHELQPSRVPSILHEKMNTYRNYCRPSAKDVLFKSNYAHGPLIANCEECDQSQLTVRSPRISDDCVIHYGGIGSSNQVMRSGEARDAAALELDVMCFEMEAAGVMDVLPCLPIRGICDYSDSHKSKEWQRYAAAAAAAYARELIEVFPAVHVPEQRLPSASAGMSLEQALPKLTDSRARKEHQKKIISALGFEKMDSRRTNIETAESKTCSWLLNHPGYRDWLDGEMMCQHRGFLWLRGKPGAGKSTIMKFVYLDMKRNVRAHHSFVASFFFNARGEPLERSIWGLYRSLLLQLLDEFSDLRAVLDNSDLVPMSQSGCPLPNVLKELFLDAVVALGRRSLVLFIDALDECDEQQVQDMVYYFEKLAEQAIENGVTLRICFSSRHYPYIDIKHGIRLTLEDQHGHAEDLQKYVARRLWTEDSTLTSILLAKSSGVFLWVVLVVNVLNSELGHGGLALKKRLEELPGDLSALFKEILTRDNENMEALLLCVLWILHGKEHLEPEAFYHALWSGLSISGLADPGLPCLAGEDVSDRIGRCITNYSKGLAEVTKSAIPTVQFIHESVRDFLLKDNGIEVLWPELAVDLEGRSNEKLAQCCIEYLNHTLPLRSITQGQAYVSGTETFAGYPFLRYASQQVLFHANGASQAEAQATLLRKFSVKDWVKISNLVEKGGVWRHDLDPSLFHLLAEQGHAKLISAMLMEDSNVHVRGGKYEYPIFAALARGNKEAVAAILNTPSVIRNGTDITKGLLGRVSFSSYHNRTPITWCAEGGHAGIAELLLQSGINVNEPDFTHETALFQALKNDDENFVGLLCSFGANVNACDDRGWAPLSWAVHIRSQAVVKALLEYDADVNATHAGGPSMFGWAIMEGTEAILELFVDYTADLNAGDLGGRTPLSYAASTPHRTAVIKVLLDHGADINRRDCIGRTPLSYAAGSPLGGPAVKMLLECNADVDASDKGGRAPLSYACDVCAAGDAAVKNLLAGGADVNARDLEGKTALFYAVQSYHRRIIEMLLNFNADVNAIDVHGKTPLAYANDAWRSAAEELLSRSRAV